MEQCCDDNVAKNKFLICISRVWPRPVTLRSKHPGDQSAFPPGNTCPPLLQK